MVQGNMKWHSLAAQGILLIVLGFLIAAGGTAQAQAPAGCPDSITAYWRFDEAGGTSFADSVGTNAAACAEATCPVTGSGRISGAVIFDGVDDGLNVPPISQFNWGPNDSFSIEFWMKTDSASTCAGTQVVIGKDDSATQLHWWVGCWNGGKAGFYLIDKTGNAAGLTGATDLTDGLWHHIVAVRDAALNEIRLYVDGKKEDSLFKEYPGGFDSASANLNIGWLNLLTLYHFAGSIDELATYGKALPEDMIRQHYYDGYVGLRRGYCGCAVPAKIMPLGDSITYGTYGVDEVRTSDLIAGFRQPLYLSLAGSGYYADLVGSRQDGENALPAFDSDHQGMPGYTDLQIANNVYSYLQQNPADVVLLHIGTNDRYDSSAADVENILNEIDRYSPDVTVLLARIINRKTHHAMTTQYNDNVEAMALARIAQGDKIIMVDQEAVLNYVDDMADNLHPNDAGYQKMADAWLHTLDDFLPLCGNIEPLIISTPIAVAYKGLSYTYNVDATGNPAPSFSLTNAPAGMNIQASSGVISWQPGATGSFGVTVQAGNTVGADTQSFTVQVMEAPFCSSGLTHYWTFEESVPPYLDFYGGNNATCTRCPSATSGVVNGAQQFSATTQLNAADDNTFDWGQGDSFSIEFWMKTDSSSTCSGNQVIVGRDDSSTQLHWWAGCQTGGRAAFYLVDKGGVGTGVIGTTDLTDGLWHHVAAVRDATANQILIYVDGTKENAVTKSYTSGFDSAGASLNIGWLNLSGGYHFVGAADEIALYNRALSDGEIQQHSQNGGNGGDYCTGLAGAIAINGDALSTNAASVGLTLSCRDHSGACTEMQFSNDNSAYTDPEPYETARAWDLAAGDGLKTVYVKFRDSQGVWSLAYSDKIVLDTAAPNTTITGSPASISNSSSASFTFSSEAGATFECRLDAGSFASCTSPKTYDGLAEDDHTFAVRAKDRAGNTDPSPATAAWSVDSTPPDDGTLSAAAGGTAITLNWTSATDSGSGLATSSTYKLVGAEGAVPPLSCSGTALYQGTGLTYTHSGRAGGQTYAYRVCAYDKAGNVSAGATAQATIPGSGKMARNSYILLPEQWILTGYSGAGSPYSVSLKVMDTAGGLVPLSMIQGLSANPLTITSHAQRPDTTLVLDETERTAYVIHDESGTLVITAVQDIRAAVTGNPVLNASPTSISFGTVTVGTFKISTVTVSNTGTAGLHITSVSAPAAPFSKTGDTCSGGTIAPAGTCTITIKFSPTAAVASAGSFSISSDGGNATVQLNGTGGTVIRR